LRVQPQIFWLLIGLTMLGTATISYQMVLRGPDARFLSALLMLTWTIVIVDILDLGAGRIGDIRTSVAAYEWTLQGFQAPGPAAATAR